MNFAADLSRHLRKGRLSEEPAVAALSYWIRPASIRQLAEKWREENRVLDLVRVPRGVVFHLPPTNVDTLFVYSWILSAAVGNANVIRISPRALEATRPLLAVVSQLLLEHRQIGSTTAFVSYGHDARFTEELSSADIRVIWGGDESVRAIRTVPLPPNSSEVAFADRFSLAALDADAVERLGPPELLDLARKFFNDVFWFDQLGCASPRAIVWCGETPVIDRAADRFWNAVQEEVERRGTEIPASTAVAKLVYSAELSIDGVASEVEWRDSRLTRARSAGGMDFQRESPGGGMFIEHRVPSLPAISPMLVRKDQTLTYFGIPESDLLEVACSAAGIDRCVPVGTALEFGRFWDGLDLLATFSRIVDVRARA